MSDEIDFTNPKIRLCVDADLRAGEAVALDPGQAHYLNSVMRQAVGGEVLVFNGRDGEWRAQIIELGKKSASVEPLGQTRVQDRLPDLWLCFAPVKRARLDFIAEKATELGAGRIWPVLTAYTQVDRVKIERLRANAIEAVEQCHGLSLPEISEPIKLSSLLADWPADRRLIFCDETRDAQPMAAALQALPPGPSALLIGPEGGFSPAEREAIRAVASAVPVSLGPRILRADTAAIAALALWQSVHGDWTE